MTCKDGTVHQGIDELFYRKDGSAIPVSYSSTPIVDAGKTSGAVICFADITDRKQAEDALLENQRRLADIIEFLPDATLAIDQKGRVIIWNKEIEKMTGIPAAEMIGKGDYAYTIPFYGEARPQLMDLIFMDKGDIMARYPNIIREGDSLTAEVFCGALYNNKGAWVFAKASPLHDPSGNVVGAIERIRDITERKQAEETIRKISAAVEQSPATIVITDISGAIEYVNPKFTETTGYTFAEAIGQNPRILKTGELPPETYKALWDTILAGDVWRGEFHNKKKTGELFWEQASISPIRDAHGVISSFVAVKEDITERKEIEKALHESVEKFQNFADQSLVGIYQIQDGIFKYVNPKFAEPWHGPGSWPLMSKATGGCFATLRECGAACSSIDKKDGTVRLRPSGFFGGDALRFCKG